MKAPALVQTAILWYKTFYTKFLWIFVYNLSNYPRAHFHLIKNSNHLW